MGGMLNANQEATGETVPEQRMRYNGKELHTELGLGWYNYGFRWYDPAIGRFIEVDPASDRFPKLSTYNYASNNPIRNIDLYGLQGLDYSARYLGLTKAAIKQGDDPQQFIQAYHEAQAKNTAIFTGAVGSLFLPGPEDVAIAAIAATKVGQLLSRGAGAISKVGDEIVNGFSKLFKGSKKVGKLELEDGASFANEGEELIANMLVSEGKHVKVLKEIQEQNVKNADFLIDGVKTELKTISNISSKDLSGRIAKKIKGAGNQAGNIIIDLRKQEGATEEVAQAALNRAFGSSDKINNVRVIGEGFDIIKTR